MSILDKLDDEISIVSKDIYIDADSEVFKSCYKEQDIEQCYFKFCSAISRLNIVFSEKLCLEKGQYVNSFICLTPRTNFRYELYPEYKANRSKVIKAEAKELKDRVTKLKYMIIERLSNSIVIENIESDDLVCYKSSKGHLIASIDKDVINASKADVYDLYNQVWIKGKSDDEILAWYYHQAITGDTTDNIKGIVGAGKSKAKKIIDSIATLKGEVRWKHYSNYFESEDDAIMNMRLVRMNQYNGKEIILWNPEDDFEKEIKQFTVSKDIVSKLKDSVFS